MSAHARPPALGFSPLGFGLLAILSLVVFALTVRTLIAIRRRQIRIPE